MATIALDIGGTKIASAIFFPDGSMMFNRKRLLKGRTGHEVGKLAADILAKLLTGDISHLLHSMMPSLIR